MRLHPADRPALLAHFTSLESEDRRLRFGTPLRDESIADYVERIDFAHDGVFAVHDGALRLLAVVHVAFTDDSAELGISVLPDARKQGLGSALFERAVMHLRNRGSREAFIHCLSENGAMMHIARKHGMRIIPCGPETDARILVDPPTPQTHFVEWLQDRNADTVRCYSVFSRPA